MQIPNSIRPLLWFAAFIPCFAVADRLVDSFYVAHTDNKSVVRGRATRLELDENQDVQLLIIGDSSARYGVDAAILTERLAIPSWNIGMFHGAFAGQVTAIESELESGRELRAVLIVTTENGMALPIGNDAKVVALGNYLTPQSIRTWYQEGLLSPGEVIEWSWSLLSPSFRAGKGLERFATLLVSQSPQDTWSRLAKQRAANAKLNSEYWASRGYGYALGPAGGPPESNYKYFTKVILETPRYRWRVHPEVALWYEHLLDVADAHGVTVFHAFTPRMHELLKHPKWNKQIGDPTRAWAEAMAARHKSFVLTTPDPFSVKRADFNDTTDHLQARGARRFTAMLADVIRNKLSK